MFGVDLSSMIDPITSDIGAALQSGYSTINTKLSITPYASLPVTFKTLTDDYNSMITSGTYSTPSYPTVSSSSAIQFLQAIYVNIYLEAKAEAGHLSGVLNSDTVT